MKKLIFIVLILAFIPSLLTAQFKYDGRRIWPNTIDSTKFNKDRSIVLGPGVVGGVQMTEQTDLFWFPISVDLDSTDRIQNGTNGWRVDGTNPPNLTNSGSAGTAQLSAFGFDADGGSTGDDIVYFWWVVPEDYNTDEMEIQLYWFHLDDNGATTDSVCWDGTLQAVGSGEDLLAAGTAMTAVYTMASASDSALYITNLDPEVEDIATGDLLCLKLFVDESASQLDSGERAYLIGIALELERKEVP